MTEIAVIGNLSEAGDTVPEAVQTCLDLGISRVIARPNQCINDLKGLSVAILNCSDQPYLKMLDWVNKLKIEYMLFEIGATDQDYIDDIRIECRRNGVKFILQPSDWTILNVIDDQTPICIDPTTMSRMPSTIDKVFKDYNGVACHINDSAHGITSLVGTGSSNWVDILQLRPAPWFILTPKLGRRYKGVQGRSNVYKLAHQTFQSLVETI